MHAQALHHARAVNLDRAHAEPELVGDHLVGASIDQSLRYFAFASTERIDATRGFRDLFAAS